MKIYQPKKNITPKLLSIFPLFIGLVFFGQGFKHNAYTLIFIGTFIISIGIWTWFAKAYQYIDTVKKSVITKKRWLRLSWGREIPLSHYKYIAVVIAPRSNQASISVPISYNVNLVGKHEASDHTGGFITNMWLKTFTQASGGHVKALKFAEETAQQVGMPISCKISA